MEPATGESSWSFIVFSSLLNFFNLQQIANLGNLAAGLGIVGLDADLANLAKAQGVCGSDVPLQATVQALNKRNFQVCHVNCLLTQFLPRSYRG